VNRDSPPDPNAPDAASPSAPLRADARLSRHRPPEPPARPWKWILFAAIVAVLVLIVLVRLLVVDRFWPETRSQSLLDRAATALVEGRLDESDGTGARQLYEAAQALDPDDARPRAGLGRVSQAAVTAAQAALDAGRFDDAHRALMLARELAAPREAVDAVADALREREAADAGLDTLLLQAQAAQAQGRLDGDASAALPLYRRILILQPANADALRGRDETLATLLEQARAALRGGDLRGAGDLIAAARAYDAGHVDLPDTEARLTEELDALRGRAAASLAADRVERSVAEWRTLLAFDPEDAGAQRGLVDAAAAYAHRAERHARDFNFADAGAQLREAMALAPDSDAVRTAAAHVERSRARHAQLAPRLPAAERGRRVAVLLREAAAAEARGDLLTPPGESAYDRIRAAQLLAPDDATVARASARLLPSVRACFDTGLRANNLARARSCLDARTALGDDAGTLHESRRRLAQRWLAIGDERLGAGNLAGAEAALTLAREIDPGVPGHAEFARRVRTASVRSN